jgi:hypothetical protein
VAALAASAPLVTCHGHRPAACTAFGLTARGLVLLSRVLAHDADVLDLVPAMLLVALGLGFGFPALQAPRCMAAQPLMRGWTPAITPASSSSASAASWRRP